jgi:hypothetical protein
MSVKLFSCLGEASAWALGLYPFSGKTAIRISGWR